MIAQSSIQWLNVKLLEVCHQVPLSAPYIVYFILQNLMGNCYQIILMALPLFNKFSLPIKIDNGRKVAVQHVGWDQIAHAFAQ